MPSSSPEFKSACRQALRCADKLDPLARDRIVADLQVRFDYGGEYIAYIDRVRAIDNVRHLDRKVLAHGPSILDVQRAVSEASDRDQANIKIAYIEDDMDSVNLPFELGGR